MKFTWTFIIETKEILSTTLVSMKVHILIIGNPRKTTP